MSTKQNLGKMEQLVIKQQLLLKWTSQGELYIEIFIKKRQLVINQIHMKYSVACSLKELVDNSKLSRYILGRHVMYHSHESDWIDLQKQCIIMFLRWLRTVHVWLLVRFSVLPLIYNCAGNTCGKLVNGHERGVVN